jgi:mRNA-degrading endonuclease YafQ of YafQ-DinJ toxin-antitoxin module
MISVELTKRFKKIVREARREREVAATLKLVQEGFGNPHAHTGISIRKLNKHLYECRTGLAWRLVFEAGQGVLTFDFAGDHDEVQNYLRGKS